MNSESQINMWASMCHNLLESSIVDLSKYNIEKISSSDEIEKLLPDVVDMIKESYSTIEGGYLGTLDLTRLNRTIKLIKVVRNNNHQIIACSMYRGIDESLKTSGVGTNGSRDGKEALQAIIKSDIEPYRNWVWSEVSDAIEHYYKKYNGYPLPAIYVAECFPSKCPDEIEFIKDDLFHYWRVIGSGSRAVKQKKIIFGFKNKAIAEKVLSDINYEYLRTKCNREDSSVKEAESDSKEYFSNYAHIARFIAQLSDMYDEDGICELTPGISADLDFSINWLQDHPQNDSAYANILDNALDLRVRMPMTQFKTMEEWAKEV